MPPRFYKHKLLFDEGLYTRRSVRCINNRYNIKHIKHDLRKGGVSDEEVYILAREQKRIIVTYNVGDFKKLAKQSSDTGIIEVPQGLTPDQLDIKLNSLLSKSSEKSFYGKYTPLMKSPRNIASKR